ncbi:penicillin-binding protein 2, partial [Vibrio parahaemolyticus]|nr:penicillin-binding protein 2 [Vibrio parahaemolyticus]
AYQAAARLFASRAICSFFGIVVLMGLLVANMYNIKLNQFQDYKTRSNYNRIKVFHIEKNIFIIYDRKVFLLSENSP